MEKDKSELFNPSGCLSREAILAWKEERLSVAEKYLVEHHLQECILCREALEGLSGLSALELRNNFADVNFSMQQRLLSPKKRISVRFRISLAAAGVLALIGVFTLFNIVPDRKSTVSQSLIHQNNKEEAPVISGNQSARSPKLKNDEKTDSRKTDSRKTESQKIIIAENLDKEVTVQEAPAAAPLSSEELTTEKSAPEPAEPSIAMTQQKDREITPSPAVSKRKSFSMQGVGYSQKKAAVEFGNDSATTYFVVEEPPKFQSGDLNTFKKYTEERLNNPASSSQLMKGKLILTFTVDTNGIIKDIVVVKSLNATTDSTAIAILKNSPPWLPARHSGRPVNISMVLPLEIK